MKKVIVVFLFFGVIFVPFSFANDLTNKERDSVLAELDNPSYFVRVKAVHKLALIGQAAVPFIVKALYDKNEFVRMEALRGLEQVRDSRIAPELIRVLDDPAGPLRAKSAQILGNLRDNRAVEKLIEILIKDNDTSVQKAAVYALGEITGQDFGWNGLYWQDWYKNVR